TGGAAYRSAVAGSDDDRARAGHRLDRFADGGAAAGRARSHADRAAHARERDAGAPADHRSAHRQEPAGRDGEDAHLRRAARRAARADSRSGYRADPGGADELVAADRGVLQTPVRPLARFRGGVMIAAWLGQRPGWRRRTTRSAPNRTATAATAR